MGEYLKKKLTLKENIFTFEIKDPLTLFPFSTPGHYNVKGYELVAKIIFKKINELEN